MLVFSMVALASPPLPAAAEDGVVMEHRRPKEIPEVGFQDAEGQAILLSDFKGKVVLVNIWATWCPPCVMEMPAFKALQERYGAQGFEVVAISQDQGKNEDAVLAKIKAFYKLQGLAPLKIYQQGNTDVRSLLKVTGLPTTLILDRQGKERVRIEGIAEWEGAEFRQWLEGLLKE